ncbi:HPF/RaiA family ribosome-associated protein [Massilia glaciei]|uniref:30S ribosomal protein S30 n=1 Tax=Massilia glaciei TaxID=1524097 RepID=A0A2U2HH09_9BURK|nr:HPF/RaiA family ribosome-associated protein [Massilia glaciei]PWF44729.1 30S ribosomal protein S30 [Massilia glaciei]
MRVIIQANGFVLTEALRTYTEQRLAIALGWAGDHVRKVAVSLSDINGPRGGIDKRCKIQAKLDAGTEVIIEDTEADLYVAIDRAADRADRALVRRVERRRDFNHVRLAPDAPVHETTPGEPELAENDYR